MERTGVRKGISRAHAFVARETGATEFANAGRSGSSTTASIAATRALLIA
jgi:hypothetical protein